MNADRDELAQLILIAHHDRVCNTSCRDDVSTYPLGSVATVIADTILASDWLRNHDAQVWDKGAAHVDGRQHYDPDDNPFRRASAS